MNESNTDIWATVVMCIGIGIGLAIGTGMGFGIGITIGYRNAHNDAIQAGVAFFICNPKTGKTKLEYIKHSDSSNVIDCNKNNILFSNDETNKFLNGTWKKTSK